MRYGCKKPVSKGPERNTGQRGRVGRDMPEGLWSHGGENLWEFLKRKLTKAKQPFGKGAGTTGCGTDSRQVGAGRAVRRQPGDRGPVWCGGNGEAGILRRGHRSTNAGQNSDA